MPTPHRDTREALTAYKNDRSYRQVCADLGLPDHWFGTIGRIYNGFNVSTAKENVVRQRLGLLPLRKHYYRPCLPIELTPEQRKQIVDLAKEFAQHDITIA